MTVALEFVRPFPDEFRLWLLDTYYMTTIILKVLYGSAFVKRNRVHLRYLDYARAMPTYPDSGIRRQQKGWNVNPRFQDTRHIYL